MRKSLVQITSKITAFAKSARISSARKLFDEMPIRDTVAWNAMITAYFHLGLYKESLSLFSSMRLSGTKPDHFTFTSMLSTCAALKDNLFGQRVHGMVVVSGFVSFLPVNNAIIDMYGKCLSIEDASKMFEEMGLKNEVSWCSMLFAFVNAGVLDVSLGFLYDMPRRVVVAWNTVIAGCGKSGEVEMCLDLFKKMSADSCRPDQFTLSALMSCCAELSDPCCGFMMHGFILKSGWSSAVEVNNSILAFYTRYGEDKEILKIVETFSMLNEISWTVIIDAYMSVGNLEKGLSFFRLLPEKNLKTWTSMISGCTRNGHAELALRFFVEMTTSGVQPDDVVFGAVLHACSNMAMLGHGRMLHACVLKSGFNNFAYVGNGLVNMYGKCGDLFDSCRAFRDIAQKDLISWNTMLFILGLHGRTTRVLSILEEMMDSNIKPDKVTFIGLLMTCSHLGLIDKGLHYFESMSSIHGISPEIDHVACVVDMLGRAGELEKAKEFAYKYVRSNHLPMSTMETLFGSYYYSSQGDLETVTRLGDKLRSLNPRDEMSYVVLSNVYCASGQWRQAEAMRELMSDRGIKKTPGCSWVEVKNEVTAFVAGTNCNQGACKMMYILESDMRHDPMSCIFQLI